ncbi:hypothetical protein F6X40_01900 [Paraburkholderia sp. UCT31]|uniref:hypothetical protein n=1 Tax=Paraburkholderia sp. UCT31 TaxID=2615209 RepID=UPI0016563D6D|nr:hypothetical protein [Paraburkholderia sp. UCT31]MBC8735618.1 hypothetical protein [Paraburkholderia sp. UCT31]
MDNTSIGPMSDVQWYAELPRIIDILVKGIDKDGLRLERIQAVTSKRAVQLWVSKGDARACAPVTFEFGGADISLDTGA